MPQSNAKLNLMFGVAALNAVALRLHGAPAELVEQQRRAIPANGLILGLTEASGRAVTHLRTNGIDPYRDVPGLVEAAADAPDWHAYFAGLNARDDAVAFLPALLDLMRIGNDFPFDPVGWHDGDEARAEASLSTLLYLLLRALASKHNIDPFSAAMELDHRMKRLLDRAA
jgi:hypothetical protein